MCQPIIESVTFSATSYGVGSVASVTVLFTACCPGPFTVTGADTGGLTWTVNTTDGVTFAILQASTVSAGTFSFTATVTSEDGLTDTQTWQFTVSGSSSQAGLIGATCNPGVYNMSPGQWFAAAQKMDGFMASSSITPAETRQKMFWSTEGSFSPTDPGLLSALNNGIKVQISVKPTRTSNATTISSQQAALTSAINSVKAVSTNFIINLWNEPVPGSDFPSGGVDYPAYWANYAPTIKATGIKCVFDPGCNNNVYAGVCNWFPQLSPVPDAYYCDYYIDSFMSGCFPDQISGNNAHGFSTTSYQALADGAGIPFGLGEWGYNNKSGAPTTDLIAMWGSPIPWEDSTGAKHSQSYVNYIISLFQARIAAGKTNADISYWASGAASPNGNNYGAFLASGDFKSGIYTQPITDLTGKTTTQTILGLKQVWNAGI